MPAIWNFDVTYGTALAPAGYHRVTLQDGGSANLSKHELSSSKLSFLWYSDSPGKSGPVIEVTVLYDDEPVPAGWDKVPRALAKGGARSAFLCCRRGTTAAAGEPDAAVEDSKTADEPLPLGEVLIAYDNSVPAPDAPDKGRAEPWEKLDRSLDPVGQNVHLWWRRVSAGEQAAWTPYQLRVGDLVDARDRSGAWVPAEVIAATADTVTVHYPPWDSSWDDVISRVPAKLAPRGTHTTGKEPSSQQHQVGSYWALDLAEVDALRERVRQAASGQLEDAAAEQVLTRVLPAFIDRCMTSSYTDAREVVPAVNDLLQLTLDVVVCAIADHSKPLSTTVQQLLLQLGDCDVR
eukprot:10072-Heterococcus_DN1.PRE.1